MSDRKKPLQPYAERKRATREVSGPLVLPASAQVASPPQKSSPSFWRFHKIGALLLVACSLLLYRQTLPYPFHFDGCNYLVQNPYWKDLHNYAYLGHFSDFANAAGKQGLDPDLCTNLILRPLTYLTFYANYAFDGLNPSGYRMVNIAIHCANAILLMLALSYLLRKSPKRASLGSGSIPFISLGAAFLFLAHPLQIESVTYIVQRFTSLATFFYLLTILAHFRANDSRGRGGLVLFRALSVLSFVAGMLSEEIVFTAPFALVIMDRLLMGTSWNKAIRRVLPHVLFLPLIPILIVMTSAAQHGGVISLANAFNAENRIGAPPGNQYQYALSELGVVLSYLRLMVIPSGLNLDPDVPWSKSLLEGHVILPALALLALLAGVSWQYFRRREDLHRSLMLLATLWFFMALALSSSIFPLPDLMAEHRTYLATVGVMFGFACAADWLRTRLASHAWIRYAVPASMTAWILALCGATLARNQVWRSEVDLWTDVTTKSPLKGRPWNNLGVAYNEERNDTQKALEAFRSGIRADPDFLLTYQNLGTLANSVALFREAIDVSQRALQRAPDVSDGTAELYCNLGIAYCGAGSIDAGAEAFRRAIVRNPNHERAHECLGIIYSERRAYESALKEYEMAEALSPNNSRLHQAVLQVESVVRRQHGGVN